MRNTCCAAAVLALGALAAAEDVIPPQAVVAQYFFVRSFEGDSLNPATLTENRRAIADLEEAIYWGRRATESKLSTPRGFAILAAAHAAKGDYDGAVKAAERGEQFARDRQDEPGILEMQELRRGYEASRGA